MSDPQPPPETPYQIPGTSPAFEPSTLPQRVLTAAQVSALIPKRIG